MFEDLSWMGLLRRWSREAIAHEDTARLRVTPAMQESGWIGSPPASEADIAAAEARLGRPLPPSYREFLAITDGWPTLSFDFDRVRPVAEVDWVAAADPQLYEIVCDTYGDDWPPDSDDGPPLMNRALVLNTGSDSFLFDTGRVSADGEWATTGWTGWYPGAGDQQPSFRAGMQSHYASFVSFDVPDSVTSAEVAEYVADAYQRSLEGDRGGEEIFFEAVDFGSLRAEALVYQLRVLTSKYRAGIGISRSLGEGEQATDAAMLADLWPMFVAATLNPRDPHQSALNLAIRRASGPVAALLRSLADQYERDGGLVADFGYAPDFATAADRARTLARASRDDQAFATILDALPSWRPLSPLHLVPMGLTWDRDLSGIMTPERRLRLLSTPRGSAY
jgi:hypothetical protein